LDGSGGGSAESTCTQKKRRYKIDTLTTTMCVERSKRDGRTHPVEGERVLVSDGKLRLPRSLVRNDPAA
jgi:hypothetical protein